MNKLPLLCAVAIGITCLCAFAEETDNTPAEKDNTKEDVIEKKKLTTENPWLGENPWAEQQNGDRSKKQAQNQNSTEFRPAQEGPYVSGNAYTNSIRKQQNFYNRSIYQQ